MPPLPTAQLLGQTTNHLVELDGIGVLIHKEVLPPLQQLIRQAAEAGIRLSVASGFRSFERQLIIWNSKASGQRSVLDNHCQPIDLTKLTDTDKLWSILRWSALPGASRHHWGTDIDIWDSSCVAKDYQLQLVTEEYQAGGPFHQLSQWLSSNLSGTPGFTRPYHSDTGGIAPEPWHLSFKPVALDYEQQLSLAVLNAAIEKADILLKQPILDNLEEIFARFILC